MLVASAAMGLVAPTVAQASDVINLDEINKFSSSIRFDQETFANQTNVEVAANDDVDLQEINFEAGGFSETTTLDGKTIFAIGALDNSSGDITEATMFNYTYQMNLNTSFSGDDNLYVRLKSGNTAKNKDPFGTSADGSYLSSTNTNGDVLKVDKIWYEFPLAEKHTVWIGPRIENYYMHGASPSIYKPITKQFKLGGNGAAYGASTNSGVGWAYNADNGFSISSNVVSKQNASSTGFLTNEAGTNWSTQVAYTTDKYHVSLISAMKYNGWTDSYYTTTLGSARPDGNSTNYGLRAYWRPDDSGAAVPELSAGYDISTVEGQDADTDAFFVGLTWKDTFQADDKIGIAVGKPQTSDDDTVEPFAWEAYYSFKINDSVTMTPAIFGGSDRTGTEGDDVTGAVLETTFNF